MHPRGAKEAKEACGGQTSVLASEKTYPQKRVAEETAQDDGNQMALERTMLVLFVTLEKSNKNATRGADCVLSFYCVLRRCCILRLTLDSKQNR